MPVDELTLRRMATMNAASALKRSQRAEIKRLLRTGQIALADVLMDPPEAMLDVTVIDTLRATRVATGRSGKHALWQINAKAVRDDINLMMPLGRASVRTRAWAVEHGCLWMRRSVA